MDIVILVEFHVY